MSSLIKFENDVTKMMS